MLKRLFKSLALNDEFNEDNSPKTKTPEPSAPSSSGLALLKLVRQDESAYIKLAKSDFIPSELERLGLSIPPLIRSTNDTSFFSQSRTPSPLPHLFDTLQNIRPNFSI